MLSPVVMLTCFSVQALWSLPLSLRARGDPYAENGYASSAEGGEGGYSSGEDMEEEDGEEEMLHGSGMNGIGDEEPASVAVTESSDGFLVVAVVRVIVYFFPWFGCSLYIVFEHCRYHTRPWMPDAKDEHPRATKLSAMQEHKLPWRGQTAVRPFNILDVSRVGRCNNCAGSMSHTRTGVSGRDAGGRGQGVPRFRRTGPLLPGHR